ncbi:DUF3418 domain-containing protein [Accumulibacter sp.]|uniref:DUF3418 domain-containing protein n=1 Tax=Accumulibacter sp. TaxID=2053492 RepID=UPI0026027B81|nr:DUF3418 domain-containing protein [Accumulibacter sp.]
MILNSPHLHRHERQPDRPTFSLIAWHAISAVRARWRVTCGTSSTAGEPPLEHYRWLRKELHVQFLAQGLRTPVRVSSKRLRKMGESL